MCSSSGSLTGRLLRKSTKTKYTAFQNEKAAMLVQLEAHERANELHFEEMETLLTFAPRLGEIFTNGNAGTKVTALKLVASNATLEAKKPV
jgi:hypothetical protein